MVVAEIEERDPVSSGQVRLAAAGASTAGYLAVPEGRAWRSATVVVAAGPELDPHAIHVTRELAAAGHGALAIGDEDGATRWVDAALARLRAEASTAPPRFGVVGYGAGGFAALVAGYRCQVGAAVSVDGAGPQRLRSELLRVIDRPKRHSAPFLFLLGGDDESVRPQDLAVIRERLVGFNMRHTFIVYPRMRSGFAQPGAAAYRANEAADVWTRIKGALDAAPRPAIASPPATPAERAPPDAPPQLGYPKGRCASHPW